MHPSFIVFKRSNSVRELCVCVCYFPPNKTIHLSFISCFHLHIPEIIYFLIRVRQEATPMFVMETV